MNEKNRHILIVVAYFVLVVLLLVGTFFVLKPIRENNLNKEIVKKYNNVAEGVVRVEEAAFESEIVTEKYIGYDQDDQNIATLYTATSNNQFGSITIVVAVSPEGDIIGINALNVDQSLSANETRAAINNFKGKVNDNYDGVSGVTYTNDSVKAILNEIIKLQGDIEPPKPEEGITKLEDNKFLVAKSAEYFNGRQGMIAFNFEVSDEGVLLAYEEVYYEHTAGFKQNVLDFLDELIKNNSNISNPTAVLDDFDGKTGSTNSSNTVLAMLNDLYVFTIADKGIEGVTELASNEYLVVKDAVYNGDSKAIIAIKINLEEDVFKDYEFIIYKHTGGAFKNKTVDFLNSLKDNNINNITETLSKTGNLYDGQAGATNSTNAILLIFEDLLDFIMGAE